jgi:hypothetical protein
MSRALHGAVSDVLVFWSSGDSRLFRQRKSAHSLPTAERVDRLTEVHDVLELMSR